MIPNHCLIYYVYVIRSKKTGEHCIGGTTDVNRRLEEHNEGKSYWTKTRTPFELVYSEAYRSLHDAKIREKKLKHFKNSYTELKKRLHHSIEVLSESGGG